jgi:hypothetical protein
LPIDHAVEHKIKGPVLVWMVVAGGHGRVRGSRGMRGAL